MTHARHARHDAIVRALRERESTDRDAREKRQRGYRQSLESDTVAATSATNGCSPERLYKFRTKVPCRATSDARALLNDLKTRFPGSTITFSQITNRRQAVVLTGGGVGEPRQIGWVEHCVQTDPKHCNVRDQGLAVETDGGGMLVLRFRYPPTAVRMVAGESKDDAAPNDAASVTFAELRPALDLRTEVKASAPRLVWLTRPEVDTLNALRSREYEAFYVRFKLEVLSSVWHSLSDALSNSPNSQWHRGSHYTVVREADTTNARVLQKTVDDIGRAADIGYDRIYFGVPATDILLLYLDGDVLADFADIYFTLQNLGSPHAAALKKDFFTTVRRFWTTSQSLGAPYGNDVPAVVRMAQRALPTPAQAPLLKQDWITLRQSLIDRFGEGGRKAPDLTGKDALRPRTGSSAWQFASFPAGDVNVGLRMVYRQDWKFLGGERGEVVDTVPSAENQTNPQVVETRIQPGANTRSLGEIVEQATSATLEAMKWRRDSNGIIDIGVRALGASTEMGLEAEYHECSRNTAVHLSDVTLMMASMMRGDANCDATSAAGIETRSSSTSGMEARADGNTSIVYSRLQNRYEVLTRPAEIQNVVLVAEKLPAPAEIGLSWVRRHESILGKVLLDESFRPILDTIHAEPPQADSDWQRGHRHPPRRERQRRQCERELQAKRDGLYEHIRANILHYQRAIWEEEDPQQRTMRYRKAGTRVPLEWRFELVSGGALTIDELGDRLAASNVDGQFATYSGTREAYLDQVIDVTRPVGYYGNYAVYAMRPELGSADLFAMLHFFKSPYLRPNPETGEPQVDGSLGQVRRLTLETDGVVIDAVRDVATLPEGVQTAEVAVAAVAAPEGFQITFEEGCDAGLLRANQNAGAGAGWTIVGSGGGRMPKFFAGRSPDSENRPVLLTLEQEAHRATRLIAVGSSGVDDGAAIVSGRRLTSLDLAGASQHDNVIIAASGGQRSRNLLVGAGVAPDRPGEADRVIIPAADEERSSNLFAGVGAARPQQPEVERMILARADEWLRPSLIAA